jgi:hypothetical protein
MLKAYRDHVAERAALGIPPLPLTAKQTAELIELLKNPPAGEEAPWWICSPTACRRAWTMRPRSRPATWRPWRMATSRSAA